MARLLDPEAFGLVGMVAIFTGFAAVTANLAIPRALIQRAVLADGHRSASFWATTAMSVGTWALLALLAPLVARLFGEAELARLLPVAALALPLTGLGASHQALLSRGMHFRALALTEVFALVGGAAAAIVAAIMGAGVWSLVVQMLVTPTLATGGYWWTSGWLPERRFSRRDLSDLLGFAGGLTGFLALNFIARQADDLVVGIRRDASQLGLYTRAYATLTVPVAAISQSLGRVMLPLVAQLQDDPSAVRRIYLRSLDTIALAIFPIMVLAFVTAPDAVLVVFGPDWIGMVPFVRVFALLGVAQSIGTTVGWLYEGFGRSRELLTWSLVATPILVMAFVVGVAWGALGVAIAYAVTSTALVPLSVRLAGRPIDLRMRDVLRRVAGPALASGGMGVATWVVRSSLSTVGPGSRLALCLLFGMAFYTAMSLIVARAAVRRTMELLRGVRAGRA